MKSSSPWPLLAGVLAASIWGGMYVVSKVVLDVIPPFLLASLRLLLGFLTLALIVLIRDRGRFSFKRFWVYLGVGFIGYGLSLGFQFVGTKLSTAANGSLVTAATPALVLPFAILLLKEKVTTRGAVALVVASLGVLAVIDPRTVDLSSKLFVGNLYLVAAAVTWALHSVLVAKISRSGDVLIATALMFLGGLPTGLGLGSWELATQGVGTVTPLIVAGVLFLGFVATAAAMFLWNFAFSRLPATTASVTFFAQPVVGTLLGWVFLGEAITPLFLIGGVLIALGILIQRPASAQTS